MIVVGDGLTNFASTVISEHLYCQTVTRTNILTRNTPKTSIFLFISLFRRKPCSIAFNAYFSPTSTFTRVNVREFTKEVKTSNMKIDSLCAFSLIVTHVDFPQPSYTIDFARKWASMLCQGDCFKEWTRASGNEREKRREEKRREEKRREEKRREEKRKEGKARKVHACEFVECEDSGQAEPSTLHTA